MVTEQEIDEAIVELEAAPSSIRGCEKLVILHAMKDIYFGENDTATAKTAARQLQTQAVHTNGGSEFLRRIEGRTWEEILPNVDELLTAVKTLQPQLYEAFLRRF